MSIEIYTLFDCSHEPQNHLVAINIEMYMHLEKSTHLVTINFEIYSSFDCCHEPKIHLVAINIEP